MQRLVSAALAAGVLLVDTPANAQHAVPPSLTSPLASPPAAPPASPPAAPALAPGVVSPAGAPASSTSSAASSTGPRREATVDFVWFSGTPGTEQVQGGTAPATIRIDRNSASGASVGVLEEFANGAGAQWRSTAWIAAFTAAHVAHTPFLQTEFTVRAGGHVDGPSAGMLTTATFLSLLRGDVVLPDVTMTGTINPDGTAGPVGGIPQKLQGAAAAGKRRFGYPVGCRQTKDLRTGKLVDIEALASSLGVQAVEIRTVRDAYLLLTGVDLGGHAATVDLDVRPNPEVMEAARVRVDMWRASAESGYQRVQPTLAALSDDARRSLAWVYQPIFSEVKAAQQYERGGQYIAAEQKWQEVTINTAAAEDELAILDFASRGDLEGAFEVLMPYASLTEQVGKLLDDVNTSFASANNAVGAVNAVLAADGIVDALALLDTGRAALEQAKATFQSIESGGASAQTENAVRSYFILLLRTAPVLARAEAMLAGARMELAFAGNAEAGGDTLRAQQLGDVARAYASAASAGRAYFQSLVGLDDASGPAFAFQEPLWATASAGSSLAARYAGQPTTIEQLFAVAAGSHAYLASAALQNKFYALDFKDGAIQHRAALSAQMSAAREAALAGVARVKAALGRVPVRVVVEFNHAEELREGDDNDKLDALAAYWRTSFAAELAAELTGR